METVNVLWTGGWDSTYRILELARMNVVVQPIYVQESRISRFIEERQMNEIREALINDPRCVAKILPIKFIKLADVPENKEITDAYACLRDRYALGSQYDYLARLAMQYPGLEIGITGGGTAGRIYSVFSGNGEFKKINGVGRYAVDQEKSTKDVNLVFGNFHAPLYGLTWQTMLNNACEWGFEPLLKKIRFCFSRKERPCGHCAPCRAKIESGMTFFFSKSALASFALWKLASALGILRIKNSLREKFHG